MCAQLHNKANEKKKQEEEMTSTVEMVAVPTEFA